MTKNTSFLKALFGSLMLSAASHTVMAAPTSAATATPPFTHEQIVRGEYLSKAADCAACHTAPDGKPMAGGLPIDSPFGQIYASNITPSKIGGIGGYSEAEFARAVRSGVRADGTRLYPAMPYPSYAGLTDDDVSALYAYFTQGVEPVDTSPHATRLMFPFNQRWLMAGWNVLFADRKPGEPVEGKSATWNRGRYLVETLGHCDSCHTPRNFAMGEKAELGLSGGQVGSWQAPNITSDSISGIGGWTHAELVQYLRTGSVAGKAYAAGGMAEVIGKSLQYLSDDDISAIATYLKESQPVRNPKDTRPAFTYDGREDDVEGELRADNPGIGFAKPGPGYEPLTTGAQLYSGNCASCHQTDGGGTSDHAFAALSNNSVLGRDNADNLVMVILDGVHLDTQGNDRQMPGFADDLTDEQIAALASFVMKQYGNPAVEVTADRVSSLRKSGETGREKPLASFAVPVASALIVLIVLMLLAVLVWPFPRRRRAS